MAKYRLLAAHELETQDGLQRAYLQGDDETASLGEEKGAIVGDGTPYKVRWPTLRMLPLDAAARALLEKERQRLELNHAHMNPIEALPINPDEYEQRYIPGFEGVTRRPPKPDGAPVGAANPPKPNPPLRLVPAGQRQPHPPPPEPSEAEPEPEPEAEPEAEEESDEPESDPEPAAAAPTQALPDYVPPPRVIFGKPPFGYHRNAAGELVEDPRQQATLAEIGRMKVAHYPVRAMIERLKTLGLPSPDGSTVRKILQRQVT